MAPLLPLLRRRYGRIAREVLAPVYEVLRVGRETCDGDLDKLLIVLAVGMRTAEHKDIGGYDLDAVLSGQVETYPSLSTNVRSVADSTGIPKESVRRKVQALVEAGWIVRHGKTLSLAPYASRMLTDFREQVLQMVVRNHQTVSSMLPPQEG